MAFADLDPDVLKKEISEVNKFVDKLRAVTDEKPALIDVKAVYNKREAEEAGFIYWRL